MLARILGIGGGLVMLAAAGDAWKQMPDGTMPLTDRMPELLASLALMVYGIFGPALARTFAGGTKGFLLDFLRKNLLAQPERATDLPILDAEMR